MERMIVKIRDQGPQTTGESGWTRRVIGSRLGKLLIPVEMTALLSVPRGAGVRTGVAHPAVLRKSADPSDCKGVVKHAGCKERKERVKRGWS